MATRTSSANVSTAPRANSPPRGCYHRFSATPSLCQHRTIGLQSLPDDLQTGVVHTTERGRVKASEGRV